MQLILLVSKSKKRLLKFDNTWQRFNTKGAERRATLFQRQRAKADTQQLPANTKTFWNKTLNIYKDAKSRFSFLSQSAATLCIYSVHFTLRPLPIYIPVHSAASGLAAACASLPLKLSILGAVCSRRLSTCDNVHYTRRKPPFFGPIYALWLHFSALRRHRR